ncbi:hypothetical protein [Akkermansia muciniphila]|uniref:hypothetical protein n=2 Tax=Akkermansia TaxID=239934 RepID=UPI0015E138ED|nr:hypothetical protein [Akkermansia muciniphila]
MIILLFVVKWVNNAVAAPATVGNFNNPDGRKACILPALTASTVKRPHFWIPGMLSLPPKVN